MPSPCSTTSRWSACIFCEFCVESCRLRSIILNHQFELAPITGRTSPSGLGGSGSEHV